MKDFKNISRRGFMGLAGMTAAGSLLMPKSGLIRPAFGASPFAPVKEEDAVIAFGHVGPISDEGWTYTHHLGKLAVEKAFPKLKTLEVENIPFSADATRTLTLAAVRVRVSQPGAWQARQRKSPAGAYDH